MLYIPERNFLFVHIPRTAGNSITRTLASEIVQYDDVVVALNVKAPKGGLFRHSPANAIFSEYKLWNDQPTVWYVDRPDKDIMLSDWRLWSSLPDDSQFEHRMNLYKFRCAKRGLFPFERFWDTVKRGWDAKRICDMYIKGASVTRAIPYNKIQEHWPEICEAAGCHCVPDLPRWDFEYDRVRAAAEVAR